MDFISFEIAKKLKKKGVPQHWSDQHYILENEYEDDFFEVGAKYPVEQIYDYIPTIAAPTISQVLMWLRKEHNLYVCPTLNTYRGNRKKDKAYNLWMFQIKNIANNHLIYPHPLDMDDVYETYEQAAIAGIEYVLDNLI